MRNRQSSTNPPSTHASLRHCRRALHASVAALRHVPDPEFARRFAAMVASVEAGFREEESLLAQLDGTGMQARLADRAIILCALHRTSAKVENGDVAQGRQVLDALAHVLQLPWTLRPPQPAPHLH